MTEKSQDSRRISLLLAERKVSGVAMIVVLGAALVFGLAGFAFHSAWVVAVVILGLGLGYVVANARQDRRVLISRSAPNDSVRWPSEGADGEEFNG
jgi:hypothetical protein